MSDPVTNVPVEDVLSSIRRLVVDEKPAETDAPAPRVDGSPRRLVLTPSLRVPGAARDYGDGISQPDFAKADISEPKMTEDGLSDRPPGEQAQGLSGEPVPETDTDPDTEACLATAREAPWMPRARAAKADLSDAGHIDADKSPKAARDAGAPAGRGLRRDDMPCKEPRTQPDAAQCQDRTRGTGAADRPWYMSEDMDQDMAGDFGRDRTQDPDDAPSLAADRQDPVPDLAENTVAPAEIPSSSGGEGFVKQPPWSDPESFLMKAAQLAAQARNAECTPVVGAPTGELPPKHEPDLALGDTPEPDVTSGDQIDRRADAADMSGKSAEVEPDQPAQIGLTDESGGVPHDPGMTSEPVAQGPRNAEPAKDAWRERVSFGNSRQAPAEPAPESRPMTQPAIEATAESASGAPAEPVAVAPMDQEPTADAQPMGLGSGRFEPAHEPAMETQASEDPPADALEEMDDPQDCDPEADARRAFSALDDAPMDAGPAPEPEHVEPAPDNALDTDGEDPAAAADDATDAVLQASDLPCAKAETSDAVARTESGAKDDEPQARSSLEVSVAMPDEVTAPPAASADAPTQTEAGRGHSDVVDLGDMSVDDGFALDDEALRDMVADVVREELHGALGERITRNVRKLVRREINRALAGREWE
ncbi:hypothetical protein ACFMPD_08295 [Sedimentitalea sp. HM32M-2]|uniref:hypothetical protein n=1 Tax=Sedimentitalea sp. HM32M-2 TaxID=3351566 RepID=UPI003643FA49